MLSLLFLGLFVWFFHDKLLTILIYLGFDTDLFQKNFTFLAGLLLVSTFNLVLVTYSSNLQRIVVPEILSNIVSKIGLPLLVLWYFYSWITENQFKWFLVILKGIILIGLISYLVYLKQFKLNIDWTFYKIPLLKRMLVFSSFGVIGNIGSVAAFEIDSIMVASLIDLKNNGIYNIALFIGSAIAIPYKSIIAISSPLISAAWNKLEIADINTIYQKSSLNLLIIGMMFFLVIWVSIEDIFHLTPKYDELIAAKYVVFFLGAGKVIDMTAGISSQIITFSKFYKFNLVAVIFLGIVSILTNYFLIPSFHIVGAAMATALSLTLFNLFKFFFILIKFKMQPFTNSSLKVLGLSRCIYLIIFSYR